MGDTLKNLVDNLEAIRQLFDGEGNISVMDSNGVILGYSIPEGRKKAEDIEVGKKFIDPTGAFDKVIKTGKKVHNYLPKEVAGIALEGNLVPIKENGQVIGCIIFTYEAEEKERVKQIAAQFKESVNNIDNSIHDIINGTEELANVLKDMDKMTADVEKSVNGAADVVKNMSDEEQTRYIDTIITLLAAGNRKPVTITTGMVSDKKTLQRRFTMIKNKIKMSKKTVIIVAVLTLAIVGCTVFASGVLNGNLIDEPEDEIAQQTSKEPKLEKIETETGEIVYDKENGEVVSATSEPKLVAAGETDADPQQQKLPRIEKETSEKATNTEIVVDASENSSTGPVLKEIEFDADFESNPVQGEVSMNFGKREHPITKEVKEHNGIDIKAPEGTKVVSSINGTV